jgi:predicted metalloprotease with PDZ domain
VYLLHYTPNSQIVLAYQVKQGWNGPVNDHRQFLAPILQDTYFHFNGAAVLIYPQAYMKENTIKATFDFHLPKGWSVANSYGANNFHQEINANPNDILTSLFLGGDYRLHETKFKGGVIWSAIRLKWKFPDSQFESTVVKIISNERTFWNDYNHPYFLMSLMPIGISCNSMGGTAQTNSFDAFLGSECSLSNDILSLLAHEIFHTWTARKVFHLPDNQEIYSYWFIEGFTEYYANLLNLRSKLISLEDYIKRYNKTLLNYYLSSSNSASIQQVGEQFIQNNEIQKLPYQQGEILAHNWNAKIKLATKNKKSLDDLIKELINPQNPAASNLTDQKINQTAKQYIKNGVMTDINHIYQGHVMIPDDNSLGPCVHLATKQLALYKFGFDVDAAKKTTVINSVNPAGRAFAAGLRNGQKFVSIQANPEDINQMIVLTIKDNNATKIIRYLPYSDKLKPIPQFILEKKMWEQQPDKCLVWFKS